MESKSHRHLLSLKCAQNFHTHHVSYVKHDTMLCASQYECFLFICFLFILLPSQRRRPNLHFWEMMLYIRRNSGCYHTDMSIIENIWPSATTLRRQQFHWGQPNITGNYRNGNRKSRLLCVLPGPIIILPICLRETQRFASERRMGAQKQRMWPQCYYWCVQTSAADCAAWSCPILDVRATQLLLEIQFFFCLRNWEQHLWCVIRDWEVNTQACAHDQRRGEIDTSDSDCPWLQVDFTPERRNCLLQWRQFPRSLFWITLTLCSKGKMGKSSPTVRLVAPGSRRNGASRPTS